MTAAAGEPLLEVDHIDVFYDDVQVLYQLSLEVRRGEIVTLLGSNGAGKTTTLRAITGLRAPRAGGERGALRILAADHHLVVIGGQPDGLQVVLVLIGPEPVRVPVRYLRAQHVGRRGGAGHRPVRDRGPAAAVASRRGGR